MYEELIKRLREVADEVDNDYDVDPYNAEQRCLAILQAAEVIEDLEFACNRYEKDYKDLCAYLPRWIPVKERLPDVRDSVLSLTGDCDIYVCDYIPSVKQFWTIPGDELHIDDITHWMPLPEPPKEVRNCDS